MDRASSPVTKTHLAALHYCAVICCLCQPGDSDAESKHGRSCNDASLQSQDASIYSRPRHSISYVPAVPSPTDSLTVVVKGTFPSPGYRFDNKSVTAVDDTTRIDLGISHEGGVHSTQIVPWSFSTCLPPRSEGVSTIVVTFKRQTPIGPDEYWREGVAIPIVQFDEEVNILLAWRKAGRQYGSSVGGLPGETLQVVVGSRLRWSGVPVSFRLSYDETALQLVPTPTTVHELCVAATNPDGAGQLSVDLTCSQPPPHDNLVVFDATVLQQFHGWSDVQITIVDTLEHNLGGKPIRLNETKSSARPRARR